MPRYIDADALWKLMSTYDDYQVATGYHNTDMIHRDSILFAIEQAPTVSPDEVRGVGISNPFEGVWLPVPDKIGDCLYKCSQCGFVRDAYILDVGNYCPNCGAKMEVSDDA